MKTDEKTIVRKRVRGIFLLPNLFTVGALFAGFYAIIAATQQHFDVAAQAIYIAMVLDALDGRIARLTHSQSEFGAQMDSLSDMVCFGLSPALILYIWSLSAMGKPGWLAAFFYTVCTALRLARFHSQSQQADKRYFQGLATPAAAGLIASILWVSAEHHISGYQVSLVMGILTVIVGALKVSTIRYRSFKDLDVRGKVPFMVILIIVLVLVFIAFNPPIVFLIIFGAYALSGPVGALWGLRHKLYKLRMKKSGGKK